MKSEAIERVIDKLLPVINGRSYVKVKWNADSIHWSVERVDGDTGRRRYMPYCTRQMAVDLVGEAICTQADLNRGNWVEGVA